MNATEARQKSLDNQYENAMKEIDKAVAGGWTRCSVCFSDPLYPEVAERIAENGFEREITNEYFLGDKKTPKRSKKIEPGKKYKVKELGDCWKMAP